MGVIGRLISFYRLQVELLWKWRPGRRALIKRAIVSLVVGTVAMLLTAAIMPGVVIDNLSTLVLAVILLALINALVRPVLLALFASVSAIAVIAGTLLLQVLAFVAIDWLLAGFHLRGVIPAFFGPIVFALFNTLLSAILNVDADQSYYAQLVARLARNRPDRIVTDKPGVVIVQIDGLAQPVLAHQIRAGRVPFLARWVRSGEMKLDRWTALLPSQTSASQAGILHGNNSFIPAFRWWEKDGQRMLVSNHPADAAEIVKRASNGEGLLSNDGASVGNLVTGDAVRAYLTMASMTDPQQGLGQSRAWYSFFVSPDNYLRVLVMSIGEVLKEYFQASRAHRRGIEPTMHRGWPYPVVRAATNVGLRALSTALVMEEMFRGTPVIYVDYTDYDEIAHHSGPERSETLDALDGVDAAVSSLVKAAEDAPRPYRFVLLGDHGQSLGATFLQRYGYTLEAHIAKLMGGAKDVEAATGRVEEWGPINAAVTEASRSAGATGVVARVATSGRVKEGAIDLAPDTERKGEGDETPTDQPPELVVCASGNLGLIYFPRVAGRVSLEQIDKRWPGLVEGLLNHPGIGTIMGRSEKRGSVALGKDGSHYLEKGDVEGVDPLAQYGEYAVAGMLRVDGMAACPDLLAISLLDPATDEVAAFEELIGSHGGLGGAQTEPFLLHPAEWKVDEPIVGAEAVYRQIRVWLSGVGIELGKNPAPATPSVVDVEAAAGADHADAAGRG